MFSVTGNSIFERVSEKGKRSPCQKSEPEAHPDGSWTQSDGPKPWHPPAVHPPAYKEAHAGCTNVNRDKE